MLSSLESLSPSIHLVDLVENPRHWYRNSLSYPNFRHLRCGSDSQISTRSVWLQYRMSEKAAPEAAGNHRLHVPVAESGRLVPSNLAAADVADAVEGGMLPAPSTASGVLMRWMRMPPQNLMVSEYLADTPGTFPPSREEVQAYLRGRVPMPLPIHHVYVARSVTTVAPAPPSSGSAVANSSTNGCPDKYSCTARRSAPVPLPCTRRARLRPAA